MEFLRAIDRKVAVSSRLEGHTGNRWSNKGLYKLLANMFYITEGCYLTFGFLP